MTESCETILAPIDYSVISDPSAVRDEFLDAVKNMMQFVHQNPQLDQIEHHEKLLTNFQSDFYSYVTCWAEEERGIHAQTKDMPGAEKLKNIAHDVREDLQDQILRFVLCYADINRSIGYIAAQRTRYEGAAQNKKIEWSSATTKMLGSTIAERETLIESTANLARAFQSLSMFETKYGKYEELAEALYGKDTEAIKKFRSAIRMSDFTRARETIESLPKPKKIFSMGNEAESYETFKSTLTAFTSLIEENVDYLRIDDTKLFLTAQEVKMSLVIQMKELAQKEQFLDKYFYPYLCYTIKGTRLLLDKLCVAGSLEYLITLYIKLMTGLARPLQENKDVREYEAEVLDKITYLMKTQFQEIDNIQALNDKDREAFLRNLGIFQNVVKDADEAA